MILGWELLGKDAAKHGTSLEHSDSPLLRETRGPECWAPDTLLSISFQAIIFFGRGVLLFVIFCVAFILTILICLYCLNQRAGFSVLFVQHLKNQLLENFSWCLLLLNYSCLYFTGWSWNYYQSFTILSEWGWMNSCPWYWKETGYKRGTHVVPYHFLGVLILPHPFSPKRFWEHI